MSSAHVLIVEDNPVTRKMLRVALLAEGLSVDEAGTAHDALRLFEARAPQIIVQDLHLPDMDGLELLRRVREHERGGSVAVVVLSGMESRLAAVSSSPLGVARALLKPVSPSELVRVLRGLLPERAPRVQVPSASGGRALVAASDESLRRALVSAVQRRGYEAVPATDGAAALDLARSEAPALVVASWSLPSLDGVSLALMLRALPRAPKVVLISDAPRGELEQELAGAAGVAAVVKDPESLEALLATGVPDSALPGSARLQGIVSLLEGQAQAIARLERTAALREAEVAVLSSITDAFSGAAAIPRMLEQALRRCLEIGEIDAAAVYLLGPESGRLELSAHVGLGRPEEAEATRFFGHPGLLERALAAGAVLLPKDVEPAASTAVLGGVGLESALLMSVMGQTNPVGVLLLASRGQGLSSPEVFSFARTLAGQIGEAVILSRVLSRLTESERRMRLLIDAVEDYAIFMLDPEGRVATWNRGAQRLLGYAADEILGKSHDVFFREEDRAAEVPAQSLARAARDGRVEDEGWRLRKDGSWYRAHAVLTRVRDRAGEERGFASVIRDLTQRQKTRDALRLLVAPLDIDQTMDNVAKLIVPLLGEVSVVFRRVPGEERFHPSLYAASAEVVEPLRACAPLLEREVLPHVLTAPQPELLEELREDGGWQSALRALGLRSAISVPLRGRTGPVGALLVGAGGQGRRHGAADLALLEELSQPMSLALENADLYRQAQQAIRAREDVLAIVSHDLKNPLNGMWIQGSVLQKIGDKRADDTLKELGARLKDGVSQMMRLITQLLDLAKLEAGAGQLERQRWDVAAVVRDALAPLEPLAKERKQTLAQELTPCEAEIDRLRIEQVVSNLVGNAVKYTQEGGNLRVAVTPVEGRVRLVVSDDGPGIPAEQAAHIFDRYWQPAGSIRKGSGLGLFIVQEIAKAHGGSVRVESEVGKGTTFVMELPGVR